MSWKIGKRVKVFLKQKYKVSTGVEHVIMNYKTERIRTEGVSESMGRRQKNLGGTVITEIYI